MSSVRVPESEVKRSGWNRRGFSVQSAHQRWNWCAVKSRAIFTLLLSALASDTGWGGELGKLGLLSQTPLKQVWLGSRASGPCFGKRPLFHLVFIEGAPFLVLERKPHFTPL